MTAVDTNALSPFDHIWNKAIQPAISGVLRGCDPEFARYCGLTCRSQPEWKHSVYTVYQSLREHLKEICYGPSVQRIAEELLDSKKIAAVLCLALTKEKGFLFDLEQAKQYASQKRTEFQDPVEFNKWAVQNLYINHMLAYCASVQLVYLTLMRELLLIAGLKDGQEDDGALPYDGHRLLWQQEGLHQETAAKMAKLLNQQRQLTSYPALTNADSFPVNVIIGLARMDISPSDLDMFIFAMLLCQLEEYTISDLKQRVYNSAHEE